jgi:hypothetical protein
MDGFEWRDAVNLIGFAITILSLYIAYFQIRKMTTAAEAARDAAEQTRNQNRDQFRQYVASTLRRFLTELRLFVDTESWDRAALRLDDVAEQLSQLALIADPANPGTMGISREIAAAARDWANTCRKIKSQKARLVRSKFDQYVHRVHGSIDSICGPFAVATETLS